jgi:NADPH2 dehydrogenase/N-ethylmaleimide reductase
LAGFDGVELHCTSGYLPMQFLCSGTNLRTDEYGGRAAHRARFAIECLREMGQAIGAGRVGLRVNPGNTYNDTSDENSAQTHIELMQQAAQLGLAYLHVMRAPMAELNAFEMARTHFGDRLILNDGFGPENSEEALASFENAALSYARHFIGNPDFVQRMKNGHSLTRFDRKTLYTPGAAGYTSYAPHTV